MFFAATVASASCDPGESAVGKNQVVWDGPQYSALPDPHPVRTVEFDGWEHCGWQDIRFLAVPTRDVPGASSLTEDMRRRNELAFVRDLTGKLRAGRAELEVPLPDDSVRAPSTNGSRELWFSPAEGASGAYIVEGSQVERWPRFDGGCD